MVGRRGNGYTILLTPTLKQPRREMLAFEYVGLLTIRAKQLWQSLITEDALAGEILRVWKYGPHSGMRSE